MDFLKPKYPVLVIGIPIISVLAIFRLTELIIAIPLGVLTALATLYVGFMRKDTGRGYTARFFFGADAPIYKMWTNLILATIGAVIGNEIGHSFPALTHWTTVVLCWLTGFMIGLIIIRFDER